MKLTWLIGVLAIAACDRSPKDEAIPAFARELGESTKSPGADPTIEPPTTPDDPEVMNTSASISPRQLERAQGAPLPAQGEPAANPPQAAEPAVDPATSSTPVQQPTDIAPPTAAPEPERPNVFSPPPPPAGEADTP